MRAYLVALALILGACGEDDPSPTQTPPPTAAGKAKPVPKKGVIKELKPMRRIEERVSCPTPSDAKRCDPKTPICAAGQYCLAAAKEHYCGPCPERDAIRHVFKPRDFQMADFRDPFHSFVISQPGLGVAEGKVPTEVTPKCTRKDQFVASSYSYQSLKIIGIVSQGTQRKVMLSDGRVGHIVKRGDCVGREKALVKEIGAGYITFSIETAGKTESAEYSMQLYPTAISLSNPDVIDPGAESAPLVAPPSATPPAPTEPAPATQPQPGTTTTIIQNKPETTTTVPPPSQAPTQLKP